MKKLLLFILLLVFSCEEVLDTVATDITSPIVVITYPANNSTLDSTITIRANVTDDGEIKIVDFLIDGLLAHTDTLSPYEYEWDVCAQIDSNPLNQDIPHTMLVKATDSAENIGQSALSTYTLTGTYDCADVCGGDAQEDECLVCDSDPTNDGTMDNCGTCDNYSFNDCVQDCADVWGGTVVNDDCGVCNGDGSTCVCLWDECYSIEETTSLGLYANFLTGEIPSEIGNLTNLTYLSLANNQLTGEIPSSIGSLTNLSQLYLDNNQLTGEIPSSMFGLINLDRLYLSNNQLSGVIDEVICESGINSELYFENNQLCPPYPYCLNEVIIGEQDISACPVDCAGVTGGDAVFDECGVCGGTAEVDECGESSSPKAQLLTNGSSRTWKLDENLTSYELHVFDYDNRWTFQSDGSYSYDHGTITEDPQDPSSKDLINYSGEWLIYDNDNKIMLTAIFESEAHTLFDNNFEITNSSLIIYDGTITYGMSPTN